MQEQRQLQHPLEASGFEANQRSVFASQFLAREGGVDASALFFPAKINIVKLEGSMGTLLWTSGVSIYGQAGMVLERRFFFTPYRLAFLS